MIEVELQIPDGARTAAIVRIVEDICAVNELLCRLRGTLAKYPDSIHWHFKMGKQRGTLERTWCENKQRLWLKVADVRKGQWITETISHLQEQLEKALL